MKFGVHTGNSPGLGRSFMKGPRFFVKPSQQNCCEKCIYGTGTHSATLCGLSKTQQRAHDRRLALTVKAQQADKRDKRPPQQ